MPVYFVNKEAIDLNAIAIMGVSVKSESAIGYFGTGLKFALATLLRSEHKIGLICNGTKVRFGVIKENIRGEEFNRITMQHGCDPVEKLGFTTAMGKDWEPWQAYRELACNATDEGGFVTDDDSIAAALSDYGTVFIIEGPGIEKAHAERDSLFVSGDPLYEGPLSKIHACKSDFEKNIFYRGVRVFELPFQTLYRYNIVQKVALTEDRTLKYPFTIDLIVSRSIAACTDARLIEKVLFAPKGYFEQSLTFGIDTNQAGDVFLDVVKKHKGNMLCNFNAVKLWEKARYVKTAIEQASIDDLEEEVLRGAFKLLARLGVLITREDFLIVESLGASIFGCVRENKILISKTAFDMGERFLASTIYEEHLHSNLGYQDESRALQNFLFERLFSMTEKVMKLEERRAK